MLSKNNLFLSKLPISTKSKNIASVMHKYGQIKDIFIYKCKTGDKYINARVRYSTSEAAAQALRDKDQISIFGRFIHLEYFMHDKKAQKNKDLDKCRRRVCVKHIPGSLSNQEFISIFTDNFGDIEDAYIKRKGNSNETKSIFKI